MDRYMIVIPAKNRAFNMKCDDGDSMKLETLQKLVGGPIEPVPALLSAEWAREKNVDGILLLVNEEGLMNERPLTNQRASEIGCTNTHFANPNGLHLSDHYSTAYDLYLIFKEVAKHNEFFNIAGRSSSMEN